MRSRLGITFRIIVSIFSILLVMVSIVYLIMHLSLADGETEATIIGLSAPASVEKDRFGVPNIAAQSKTDAFRALGYVVARDRLFQMDLLRRKSAGRLAEIFGETALPHDKKQRTYGFEHVAKQVILQLPDDQVALLEAYVGGINSAIDNMIVAPFEFLLLNYRPDRWRAEDSVLIVLDMFIALNGSEAFERKMSIMAQALPADIYTFLTPRTDHYTQAVLGEAIDTVEDYPVPVDSLAALLSNNIPKKYTNLVQPNFMQAGSNAWAVSGTKTRDGRAILANDMHLRISVPNIWYRSQLQYDDKLIAGVNLPGTPLIIAGATKHLAWGPTSLAADILDLVKIEVNPDNPAEYRTPDGWERFGIRHETIVVKGGASQELAVQTTIWGPVSAQLLMGQSVALHWTALDPGAISLDLLNIDQMHTLQQGLDLINRTGGPPLNMLLADHTGEVGWTIMGRIPMRSGPAAFDGSISRSWADGAISWVDYIPPDELPRLVNQDFVVNANNRSIEKDYPYIIGHAFASGYRAYRISERLHTLSKINETDMFQLQLDTVSEVYRVYRDIALAVLTPDMLAERPDRITLRDHLQAWNGTAEPGSLGLGLVKQFRDNLAQTVFEPLLQSVRMLDDEFQYFWPYLDVPLLALIKTNDVRLLPDQQRYPDWNTFLLAQLEKSAQELTREYSVDSLQDLTWEKINIAKYTHPLSQGIPGISQFLDFPSDVLPGCSFCVRVDSVNAGASMRLVISPSYWEGGILHTPGGQSGHPLSAHYQDQHPYWVKGLPIAFKAEVVSDYILKLVPEADGQ